MPPTITSASTIAKPRTAPKIMPSNRSLRERPSALSKPRTASRNSAIRISTTTKIVTQAATRRSTGSTMPVKKACATSAPNQRAARNASIQAVRAMISPTTQRQTPSNIEASMMVMMT